MHGSVVSIVVTLGLLMPAAALAATPPGATNKSVELSWDELRSDKIVGTGNINNFTMHTKVTLYISSQGKVFSEMLRGGAASAQQRQVGSDAQGTKFPFKFEGWHFEGRTLVAMQHLGQNAARRVSIAFDDGFRSCQLTIQAGRASSAHTIVNYMTTGEQVEILDDRIQPGTCSVREGNAFGN